MAIVEYEYARRRYQWSKRFNWITLGLAIGIGVVAIVYGFLFFSDWQWLTDHFGPKDSARWTPERIGLKLTYSILFFITGILGFVTFFLAFFKVKKALDEDNQDAIKRWSFLAGITGVLPGAVLGGLLELMIWRAHTAESFTIFRLLGKAPAPQAAAMAAPAVSASETEAARRKSEYDVLFGSAPAQPAAADYGAYGAYGAQAAAAPGYDEYTQVPAPAEAAPYPAEYAGAEAQAAAPAAAVGETTSGYTAQPSGAPICTCGRPMEWIPEYNRYYCYTDDKYEGET